MKNKAYWEAAVAEFSEVGIKVGDKRVFWEFIGEGRIFARGWNPDDPDDYPHLRFSCQTHVVGTLRKTWKDIPDSSYCTRLPIDSSMKHLIYGAVEVMEVLQDVNYKRRLEELSRLEENDFIEQ